MISVCSPEVGSITARLIRVFDRVGYLAVRRQALRPRRHPAPGAGDDLYARLVKDLGGRGLPVVLDAEGRRCSPACGAGASMVTPNEREAEELVGQEFADRDDLIQGLAELVRLGAGEAAITRPDGCVAVIGERL